MIGKDNKTTKEKGKHKMKSKEKEMDHPGHDFTSLQAIPSMERNLMKRNLKLQKN